MPLIPYPNVPKVPGVPALNRLVATTSSAKLLAQSFGFFNDSIKWQILNASDRDVITPDSVVAFDFKADANVARYPVEDGGFSSYNKVREPRVLRMTMTCSGMKTMLRDTFLARLEEMRDSTDLYTVVTPDGSYKNMNLISFDFSKKSTQGATMIIADATFQEIMTSAKAEYTKTAEVSGSNPQSNGRVGWYSPPAYLENQIKLALLK